MAVPFADASGSEWGAPPSPIHSPLPKERFKRGDHIELEIPGEAPKQLQELLREWNGAAQLSAQFNKHLADDMVQVTVLTGGRPSGSTTSPNGQQPLLVTVHRRWLRPASAQAAARRGRSEEAAPAQEARSSQQEWLARQVSAANSSYSSPANSDLAPATARPIRRTRELPSTRELNTQPSYPRSEGRA